MWLVLGGTTFAAAWHSVVAPRQILLIMLLIVFEAAAGLLILSGGTRAKVGLLSLLGMHIGLLEFGWVLTNASPYGPE